MALSNREGGLRVTYLGVEPNGLVALDKLEAALTDRTLPVSDPRAAHNEIGVIQPCPRGNRQRSAARAASLFHTDAAQAVGKIPIDAQRR